MRKVLIPTKLDKVVEKILSEHGFTVVQNPDVQLADLASENSDASAIIVRSEKVTPENENAPAPVSTTSTSATPASSASTS